MSDSSEQQVTAETVRHFLSYEPETGIFRWQFPRNNCCKIGAEAGRINNDGYVQIGLFGKRHAAHRLAWLYVHGRWPADQIDHVNGDKTDNRLINLRECTAAENCQNKSALRTNKSGLMGVCWHKARRKWLAQIMVSGRRHELGLFPSKSEAHRAYCEAKARLHQFQPTPRVESINDWETA